jgi:hypothetical protein
MKLGKYIGQELLEDMVIINTVVYTELGNTEYGRVIDSTWIISTHTMELINDEITNKFR